MLQERSKQFINLSRITGTDLKGNIADMTRVFGDWSVAGDQQAGTLDKIFRASQTSGIGINALSQKVVQFGAPLRQMGFGLDESIALMSKWEKEGVNSELVLGSFRIAMGNFARDNIPMRQGLDETIAKITAMGPGAASTSLAMEVFGARAGPDMAAAILEGRFAIDEYLSAIGDGSDTINGAAADTDDWREKLTVLKNQALVGLEPVLSGIFNGVGALADVIATRLVPWVREHLVPLATLTEDQEHEFADAGFKCRWPIVICGATGKGGTNIIEIEGQERPLGRAMFPLFMRLVTGLFETENGYLPVGRLLGGGGLAREGYYSSDGAYQAIHRLRSALGAGYQELVEVAGGTIRLSTHPGYVRVECDVLAQHRDARVQQLTARIAVGLTSGQGSSAGEERPPDAHEP